MPIPQEKITLVGWASCPSHQLMKRIFARGLVYPELPIYSARISNNYRAVGLLDADTVIWFWVGSHAEYDKFLGQL